MIKRIYSIRDTKAEAFLKPFYLPNDNTAIRAVSDAIEQDQEFQKHKEDYILFQIGYFDDNTGEITSTETPNLIKTLAEIHNGNQNPQTATLSA